MSSYYPKGGEKRKSWPDMRVREQQEIGSYPAPRSESPNPPMEQEKRMRREIANSNERRRMQSINAGFQSLKGIIPHHDGEKLSKAAILQATSDYIYQLEHDRNRFVAENNGLKQMLREMGKNPAELQFNNSSPPPKRKKRDTESSDEGIGMSCGDTEDHRVDDLKREIVELRNQLEAERKRRMRLEKRTCSVESKHTEDNKDALMQQWMERDDDTEAAQHVPRLGCSPSPPHATSFPPPAEHHQINNNPLLSQASGFNTCMSVSRRNLDTIVEAIRHLEGDSMSVDLQGERQVPMVCRNTGSSEESGTESSYEQEDNQSLSDSLGQSGRESPLSLSPPMECEASAPTTFTASAMVHVNPQIGQQHIDPLLATSQLIIGAVSNKHTLPVKLLQTPVLTANTVSHLLSRPVVIPRS